MAEQTPQAPEQRTPTPRNSPPHSDGRATPASVEKRLTEKWFPQDSAPAKAETPSPQPSPTPTPPPQPADTPEPSEQAAKPEPAASEEEDYEFEFGDGRYRVPAALKPLHEAYKSREEAQRDYTEKTTRAADILKTAELHQQNLQQQQALHRALEPKYRALSALDQQIQQYENLDWTALVANNAQEALAHNLTYQQLKSKREKAAGELSVEAQQLMKGIDETRTRVRSEHTKIMQRDVKGWDESRAKKVSEFAAAKYGFSEADLTAVFDSRVMKMMNDAFEWNSLQSSKPQTIQQAAQAAKTLRPQASGTQNARKAQEQSILNDIKSAKSPRDKEKHIERLHLLRGSFGVKRA